MLIFATIGMTASSGVTLAAQDILRIQQIPCPADSCIQVPFSTKDRDGVVESLLEKETPVVILNLENHPLPLESLFLEKTRTYLREVSKRDGRIVYEPIAHTDRSLLTYTMLPVAKDVVLVSLNVFERIYNYFRYDEAGDYNVKIVYNPANKNRILYVAYIHRNMGDPCHVLYSDCQSLEFFDGEAFDQELSRRLRDSAKTGQPVRVTFSGKNVVMPGKGLDLESITGTGESFRVYKWFLASKRVEALPRVTEKFLPLNLVVNVIDLGLKIYDLVEAWILYEPASNRVLQVRYTGKLENGTIDSMVFLPPRIQNQE